MGKKMKDSGIEWIGEIPEDWEISKIKYGVEKVGSGKTPRGGAETYPEQGILFLRSQNIYDTGINLDSPTYISEETDEEMKNTRVYPNDVLLNITGGSIGRCCIFPQELKQANVNQHVSIIRVNKDVFTPEYVHYFWICSLGKSAIDLYQTGGNREGMSADAIKNTFIPYISVAKQREIASYLDRVCRSIDTSIDKTKETIETYKSLKQSLITRAVTKGIRGEREMKDSGMDWLPELPIDWESIPAKYLFQNVDVRRLPDDERLTASQKYGIITQAEYMERENAKVVTATKNLSDWKHVEPNDFIISLRSFQGGLEMSEVSGCITWHYIVLRARRKVCHKFYKWLFKSSQYINALQGTCNFIRDGQDLRFSNFSQVPLYIPSLEEQEEIAAYLDEKCSAIDTLIAKKEQLLSELETYKKSLIYEYVTGKREVPA